MKKHRGDLKDLGEPIHIRDDQERYNCPYCLELRGKEDTKAKFYYTPSKRLGHCFKCESYIRDESVPERSELMELVQKRMDFDLPEEEVEEEFQDRELMLALDWTVEVDHNPEVKEYLESRGVTKELIDRYNLRACSKPVTGVVFPNFVEGNFTDYLQVRDINPDTDMKYINLPKLEKPLYGVGSLGNRKKAFICEGVLSAISASRLDSYAGLCTFGKSIKKAHLLDLGKLPVEAYYLSYDGGELSSILSAAKSLKESTGKLLYITLLPYGKDPNDLSTDDWADVVESCTVEADRVVIGLMERCVGNAATPKDAWGIVTRELKELGKLH